MLSAEVNNILNTIEIIQKSIYVILFIVIGLGAISIITNIIRLAGIRMILSIILVVSSMIINIVSKFLTLDLMIYHVDINTLILAVILLLMQVLVTILLLLIIFKRKK